MDEPVYFGVVRGYSIKHLFTNHADLDFHIVVMSLQVLSDPAVEPIGMFQHDGSRIYMWRGQYWAEFCLPLALSKARISDALIVSDIKESVCGTGPYPGVERSGIGQKNFVRCLYTINNQSYLSHIGLSQPQGDRHAKGTQSVSRQTAH